MRIFTVFLLCFGLNAANTSRYPSGYVGHSGNIIGVVKGSYEDWLPLKLQFAIDPTFSDEQRTILSEAIKIFIERGLTRNVLDCAYRSSSRDMPSSRELFETQLASAFTTLQVNSVYFPSFAFIAHYWNDRSSVGLGFVNLFYDKDKPMPGYDHRHYLHIGINSDHLGSGSQYFYRDDIEYWAGVLGHEFLHNLGYIHPNGYPGSFISEYGHCISKNGMEWAPLEGELGDTEVFKDL